MCVCVCFAMLVITKTTEFCLEYLISICFLRQDKESWIRSKYVEKKFIHKLPETGRATVLRRSSARRNRSTTQERPSTRPALKPKPNRATLPRLTGTRTHMPTNSRHTIIYTYICVRVMHPRTKSLYLCFSFSATVQHRNAYNRVMCTRNKTKTKPGTRSSKYWFKHIFINCNKIMSAK